MMNITCTPHSPLKTPWPWQVRAVLRVVTGMMLLTVLLALANAAFGQNSDAMKGGTIGGMELPAFAAVGRATSSVPVASGLPVPPSAVLATPREKIGSLASEVTPPTAVAYPPRVATTQSNHDPSHSARPNVVRLVAFDSDGQSYGSGSYIGNVGKYGLILSNWHVICESNGLVHVHFSNGFSSFGAVVQADREWDLALIAISQPPPSVLPLPIAQVAPKPGDPLWIAGFGSGSYRMAGGSCVRYLAPSIPRDGSTPQYEIIELSATARQGDSGGPILNQRGELAGVLFGSDMVQNTAGSFCKRVSLFLQQTAPLVGKLPETPEWFFASIEKDGPRVPLTQTTMDSLRQLLPAQRIERPMGDIAGASSFGIRSASHPNTLGTPNSRTNRMPLAPTVTPVAAPIAAPVANTYQ